MNLIRPSCLSTALSITLAFPTYTLGQIATPDFGSGHPFPGRNNSQGPSAFATPLSGQIIANPSSDLHHLLVQIVDPSGNKIAAEATPNLFGSFDLPSLPNGLYELRVINRVGVLVHTMSISLPYANTIEIRLVPANSSVGSGHPASLSRMQHKIPKKAQREFDLAQRASAKGSKQQAILHFEKALAIDPLYFEALNNLGVQFARLSQFEQACQLFTRATVIDPADPLAEMNLAFTLLSLHRFPEAEQAARASLRSDSLSPRARFYLAISLLEQNKAKKEALFHLAKAADTFEPAKKLLAQLHAELMP